MWQETNVEFVQKKVVFLLHVAKYTLPGVDAALQYRWFTTDFLHRPNTSHPFFFVAASICLPIPEIYTKASLFNVDFIDTFIFEHGLISLQNPFVNSAISLLIPG